MVEKCQVVWIVWTDEWELGADDQSVRIPTIHGIYGNEAAASHAVNELNKAELFGDGYRYEVHAVINE